MLGRGVQLGARSFSASASDHTPERLKGLVRLLTVMFAAPLSKNIYKNTVLLPNTSVCRPAYIACASKEFAVLAHALFFFRILHLARSTLASRRPSLICNTTCLILTCGCLPRVTTFAPRMQQHIPQRRAIRSINPLLPLVTLTQQDIVPLRGLSLQWQQLMHTIISLYQ